MRYARKLNDDPAEKPTRHVSRETQLRLQGSFADRVAVAADNEPFPGEELVSVREEMNALSERVAAGDPEARRDMAWLRYYRR